LRPVPGFRPVPTAESQHEPPPGCCLAKATLPGSGNDLKPCSGLALAHGIRCSLSCMRVGRDYTLLMLSGRLSARCSLTGQMTPRPVDHRRRSSTNSLPVPWSVVGPFIQTHCSERQRSNCQHPGHLRAPAPRRGVESVIPY
jgi:hypothetical protein